MIPDSWDIELRRNASRLAVMLLQAGAVRYDRDRPVRHGSGVVSPIHVEGRVLLSYPVVRKETIDLSIRMIEEEVGWDGVDAIAAFDGAGVPFAVLIAHRMGLPFLFVRRPTETVRSHKDLIEGPLAAGMSVLPVDQLVTDGRRKPAFIEPLKAAGCRVEHMFVLFQYGIYDVIHENLTRLGVTVHALCTWWDLLEAAGTGGFLDERARAEIHAFLNDPGRWSDRHSGDQPASERPAA